MAGRAYPMGADRSAGAGSAGAAVPASGRRPRGPFVPPELALHAADVDDGRLDVDDEERARGFAEREQMDPAPVLLAADVDLTLDAPTIRSRRRATEAGATYVRQRARAASR